MTPEEAEAEPVPDPRVQPVAVVGGLQHTLPGFDILRGTQ